MIRIFLVDPLLFGNHINSPLKFHSSFPSPLPHLFGFASSFYLLQNYWCTLLKSGSFQVLRIATNCIWWRKGRHQFNLELFHQQLSSSCTKLNVNLLCNAAERKAHSPFFFILSVTSWKDSFAFWWPPPPSSSWRYIKEHKRRLFNWNFTVWLLWLNWHGDFLFSSFKR